VLALQLFSLHPCISRESLPTSTTAIVIGASKKKDRGDTEEEARWLCRRYDFTKDRSLSSSLHANFEGKMRSCEQACGSRRGGGALCIGWCTFDDVNVGEARLGRTRGEERTISPVKHIVPFLLCSRDKSQSVAIVLNPFEWPRVRD
jgi:hypothetical protein